MTQYPFSAYDRYLCLRMSFGLWLVLLFLARAYAVLMLSLANIRAPLELINMFYHDRTVLAVGAVAALPALVVFYAWTQREPGASARVRWIWHRGPVFLAVSAGLNALALLPWLWIGGAGVNWFFAVQLGGCAYILFFLFGSQRVKDTFADFPENTESAEV